jgi:three-Cys-motif partner protein
LACDLSRHRSDTVGPWSEHIKLDINRLYLPAYMRVMEPQRHWCTGGIHYIDAFAGSGQPIARGEDRLIDGSPVIAMSLPQPFDSYTFIEQEPWRAERLRAVCARFPDLNTRVIEGDCNSVIVNQVTPVVRREHKARGFAFLDPFAMHLDYATIAAIADTQAIEVVLNLPTMAMNRNGLPNDPRKLTPSHYRRMDGLWGDRSWFDLIYQERQGLWGAQLVKAGRSGAERLGRLFKEHRLDPIFDFVGEPLVVPNSSGIPIYCLIHASPNKTGSMIASDVFRKSRPLPPSTPAPATLPLFTI